MKKIMTPEELAREVYDRFRTRGVAEIAEMSGIKIVFQRWHPVTWGELDRRGKTITVNENASLEKERIIAHELGHYFLREFEIERPDDEEKFCDAFADSLLDQNV